jgi:hypothetical protein
VVAVAAVVAAAEEVAVAAVEDAGDRNVNEGN